MPRRRSSPSNEQLKAVLDSVEDYLRETHHFPGVSEIRERVGLAGNLEREALEKLVSQKQLCIVYRAKSHPTLFSPTYMMNEVFRAQSKPKWVDSHLFLPRDGLDFQIAKAREELTKIDLVEGLLYRTDIPLQDSVEHALKLLEFEEVEQRKEDTDNPDITFRFEGKKFISEVKGKSAAADKPDILQLDGWIKAEIDTGADPTDLLGLMFVNHYRHLPPGERGDFLTPAAKKFARLYSFKVLTTVRLFELVQQVAAGDTASEDARKSVVEGEKYG